MDIENRIVCFDIKDLGKQMKKIGMLVVQDQVWGRVTQNRSASCKRGIFSGAGFSKYFWYIWWTQRSMTVFSTGWRPSLGR